MISKNKSNYYKKSSNNKLYPIDTNKIVLNRHHILIVVLKTIHNNLILNLDLFLLISYLKAKILLAI